MARVRTVSFALSELCAFVVGTQSSAKPAPRAKFSHAFGALPALPAILMLPRLPAIASGIRWSRSDMPYHAIRRLRSDTPDCGFTLDTFGSRAVVQVPELQNLMQFVCKNGFEHHAAMTTAHAAAALHEPFTTYFGWDTHWHRV
jgi:hypothetical protein